MLHPHAHRTLAVGNALVDIITPADEGFLNLHGLEAGSMHLVNAVDATNLLNSVGEKTQEAGGSAANTAVIIAALGGDVTYIGQTKDDDLGEAFATSLSTWGVKHTLTPLHDPSVVTGHCLSLVSKTGQRTMATHLGAATQLPVKPVLKASKTFIGQWLFFEGYLLDTSQGPEMFLALCQQFPGHIALTLSDPRCVERHHALLKNHLQDIGLLIGNEAEMEALFGHTTPQDNLKSSCVKTPMSVCSHGAQGVFFQTHGVIEHVPATPTTVVDTTGAGDSLAGGILWALTNQRSLREGCELGSKIASHIVSVVGSKPKIDIKTLL